MDSGSRSLRSLGRNDARPVFREPWHAHAFALAVSLSERGVFSRQEWAATLGEEIKKAQADGDPDTGETYYLHWLAALERLIAVKGLADAATLAHTREAWRRATARTPHGTPIELKPSDFDD
jgi:nitrile hydratase accessory protein